MSERNEWTDTAQPLDPTGGDHQPDADVSTRQDGLPAGRTTEHDSAEAIGAYPTGGGSAETPWRRLDRRMLLLHPVREVVRYIPALLVTLIAGSQSDNPEWSLALLAVIVGLAVTRWFTTTYRIGPETVQLRQGLLQRKTLTVPRSRIRSVDVHADLMHRLLGLVVLAIGTGQHATKRERFHLDGVDARQVPELRALLLHEVESAAAQATTPAGQPITDSPTATPQLPQGIETDRGIEIGHWQPGWVRYAPLSLRGLAILVPIIGLAFKFGIANVLFNSHTVKNLSARGALFIAASVAILLVALIVVTILADCLRYLTTYFGLRVIDDGTTLHIRNGLFTTRQTTLDLTRLRGATLKEPLLLRLAHGAELEAIMTGSDARKKILPQAPRTAVDHTLTQLLASRPTPPIHQNPVTPCAPTDQPDFTTASATAVDHGPHDAARATGAGSSRYPLDTHSPATIFDPTTPNGVAAPAIVPLIQHGPRARRRRFTRALAPLAVIALAMAATSLAGVSIPTWPWIVLIILALLATALAHDRYQGLGHAVIPGDTTTPTWLITRNGSLDRDRDCLESPGIIGWTIRQTFFQRRAGLATLIAATAAGKKRYRIVDIPLAETWPLIESVTPGQLGHHTPR
ncbi:PH domain-containing protein [Nocardia alni]|uniref:PH domain-containing protein n=1 Tax=Nocardia alni TaxID=2815723 RepID=UPI0027E1419C|nr:PH domain-containing protein [Nocardia alni]